MKASLRKRWGLAASLVFYVFITMIAAMALAALLVILLSHIGLIYPGIDLREADFLAFSDLIAMFLFSVVLGCAIAAFFSKKALLPIRNIIEATNKVADGDFSVTVETGGIPELEELSQSFNRMTKELSSIETMRSDFINNFSHEFKTPIVSIRGFAKLLREGDLTEEEQNEYLEIIFTESERLANLSTSILNLSKYEAIEIITEKSTYRIDEQLRRAILLTEPKWSAKNLSLDIQMDEASFCGDADLTQQLWLNLLDNAIKFSNEGGNIKVSSIDSSLAIYFTIQDDGIGMDEETKQRIFDKFFQGDKSHKQQSNGLGLAMVKRIVELHGGKIIVDSSLGNGSVFTVVLPKNGGQRNDTVA
jgi:signal transduction histidine kinase